MPRCPVLTCLIPHPATLSTTMATIAMTTQVRILRIGKSGCPAPPPLPAPPPRKIGLLKAMIPSPVGELTSAQALAPGRRQQRNGPQRGDGETRGPALAALGRVCRREE